MARTRSQRQATAAADAVAAKTVANTYELVEQIVLRLRDVDPLELFRVESVSPTFQHVLRRSKKIPPMIAMPRREDVVTSITPGTFWLTEKFQPIPPIFSIFEIIRRNEDLESLPEILLHVRIDEDELATARWRTGGMWRSWLVLRSTTKYISRIDVEGKGAWNPKGVTQRGEYSSTLKYTSKTPLTLGLLVDIAYELDDLSEDYTDVQFEFAIDDDGNARLWLLKNSGYDPAALHFEDREEKFPDYHKTMKAARALKEAWKEAED